MVVHGLISINVGVLNMKKFGPTLYWQIINAKCSTKQIDSAAKRINLIGC